MNAFLKIDDCRRCGRSLPWEWVPAVLLNGKALAGTGVWRSALVEGHCDDCASQLATEDQKKDLARRRREELVALLGGEKPFREFTFEQYETGPGNRLAF